jgi:hypothetical protein
MTAGRYQAVTLPGVIDDLLASLATIEPARRNPRIPERIRIPQ